MPQFDVYRIRDGTLAVDCQSHLLSELKTRFVIPLLPTSSVGAPERLSPRFEIDGTPVSLFPQGTATVPAGELVDLRGSLAPRQHEILNAIDFLLGGF